MAVGVALPPSPLRLRSRTLFPSISIKVASTGDSHSIPKVVVTREHVKNGKLINALAKHAIHCLEMPLIQHDDGPDLPKLPSVLAGKVCWESICQDWYSWKQNNQHNERSSEFISSH